ncbi:MAG: SDR family NAD(P)-dependent oxidoreductase, partial [Xanthobacteraceae bacterium]
HEACRSLQSGEASMALVGGVNMLLKPTPFIGFSKASMLSPSGRCRAFDAAADGYVRAEGGGVLLLKPLAAAERDGDFIHGVIVGSGVNSDGRTRGLSLPNDKAQEELLRTVYRQAGLSPQSVFYVEAHGTGTPVGDPLECEAMGRVVGARSDGNVCFIGSIKSNIGHLEAASGIAGLTKVLLALRHRKVPGNLHFAAPNPKIEFDRLKLRVVTEMVPLPDHCPPVVMGVNSFGFGGTNAHVVVREHRPEIFDRAGFSESSIPKGNQILLLSAHNADALADMAREYSNVLRQTPQSAIEDFCATAALRRSTFSHRLATCGETPVELAERLQRFACGEKPKRVATGHSTATTNKLAFVFCGNGPQRWGMGRELLASNEAFRRAVARIDAFFEPLAGWSVLAEMGVPEAQSRMARTEVAQPCLFALQVGLVAALRAIGIVANAVVGHSVGEVAAAYVSGALTLEQAVKVIFERSRCQGPTAGFGGMAAVGLGAEEIGDAICDAEGWIEIAAINSPKSVTLSGDPSALDRIGQRLADRGVFVSRLALDYAFHSRAMDPIQSELTDALEGLAPTASNIAFISSVTGTCLEGTALDARYWWRNVRDPVRFHAAVDQLLADDFGVFLEIGPHPVLRDYLNQAAQARMLTPTLLATLKRPDGQDTETDQMWSAVCACHANAVTDPEEMFAPPLQRIELPFYPWQRESHWNGQVPPPAARVLVGSRVHPLLGYRVIAPGTLWAGAIDLTALSYLADHVIEGSVLFPAAGFVEMALAGGCLVHGDTPCDVEDIDIRRPLVLPSSAAPLLQLIINDGDGSFRIASFADSDPDRSTLHVTGRVAPTTARAAPEPFAVEAAFRRLTGRMTKAELYQAAAARELNYGPAFRGVESVAFKNDEAIGEIRAAGGIAAELEAYRAHPCLLDSCFQVLIGLLIGAMGRADTATYLPVFIDRVRSYRPLASTAYCHVRLAQKTSQTVRANLRVLDSDGVVLAEIQGFRLQRIDFSRHAAHGLYSYRCEPSSERGMVQNAEPAPPPSIVAGRVSKQLPHLIAKFDRVAFYKSFQPRFDRLCAIYAARALEQLGARDGGFSAASLTDRGGVKPEYARQLALLIEMAAADGLIASTPAGWLLAPDSVLPEPDPLWRDLLLDGPNLLAELSLLGRCGNHLASILQGEVDALELLFPEKGSASTELFYDTSPMFRAYNHIAQEIVRELVGLWPARPLRILEIGGGTGGLTAHILPILPADRTDYLFTDVSPFFLGRAQQRFGSYGFMRFATLDIERDPQSQDNLAEGFDLVVAGDVLHATADLKRTLRHVHQLLAPDGRLLLLEKHRERMSDLVFGLLKGWWLFTDTDLRANSPLLSAGEWQRVLREIGFQDPVVLSDADALADGGKTAGPQHSLLLAARRATPSSTLPSEGQQPAARTWLFMMDEAGSGAIFGDAAVAQLIAAGERVLTARTGEGFEILGRDCFRYDPTQPDDIAELIHAITVEGVALDEIVHLAGIAPIVAAAPSALSAAQDVRCLSVLHFVQARSRASMLRAPRLWLVTANLHALPDGRGALEPAQAPLWGLGRVLVNEHPELRCRLVDLSIALDDPAAPALLTSELSAADEEDEVVRAPGARYVNRYRRTTLAEQTKVPRQYAPEAADLDGPPAFRLDFAGHGNPDHLYWRTMDRRAPGPDQVEIRVRAAGLNFKDVMCVMGLLPPEAMDIGHTEYALGLECAGEVVSVGPGVTDHKPGDRVIAFAWGSFSSHAIADVKAVLPIPTGLGFEAAATIPAVFLTACYALDDQARLAPDERILIHGAAGGVGLAAIQIAKLRGAEVFGTAGSDEKREFLRMLGVDHVLDSRTLVFADDIMKLTDGVGVDVVLNSLAGEAIHKSLRILKPFGRFVEIGKRDLYANSKIGLRTFRNNISYFGVNADLLSVHRPDLITRIMNEIRSLFDQGKLHPLPYRVFPMARIVDAFRTMQHARHIGKLVVTMDGTTAIRPGSGKGFNLRTDATYLVTGGLSGLGLATAQRFVANGARHLALVGRRGAATEEARNAIAAMQSNGVSVRVFATDVADEAAVAQVITEVASSMPPLRGVVHAAMVLEDSLVVNLDRRRMHAVLAPKMLGAFNLHQLTRDIPLDFFVMFSSLAAAIGSPGQASYVAANAYLEALAEHRRARGLAALVVGWGPVSEIGYVARNEQVVQRLERSGFKTLSPAQVMTNLEELLAAGITRVYVASHDWRGLRSWPILATPKMANLAAECVDAEQGTLRQDFRAALAALPEEKRREFVITRLQDHIALVIATTPAELDVDRPLSDIGLDSLMAVELATQIEADIDLDVPVLEVIQSGTIAAMADWLLRTLGSSDAPQAPSAISESLVTPLTRHASARWNLIGIPYIAGGANVFGPWTAEIGRDADVLAVHLPGHDGRISEPAYDDIDVLVAALGPSILPYTTRRYAIYGHSFGAVIAFELARWLRSAGARAPEHLFVGAHGAPRLPSALGRYLDGWPKFVLGQVSQSVLAEFLKPVLPRKLIENGALLERVLPTIRTELGMLLRYCYTVAPPLECPITCFGGAQDVIAPDTLQAWEAETNAEFRLIMLPSDHLFLRSQTPAITKLISHAMDVRCSELAAAERPDLTPVDVMEAQV